MKITVASRIKRTIGKLRHFVPFENVKTSKLFQTLNKNEGEEFYGIYKNPKPAESKQIVISNKGLHIFEDDAEQEFVLYDEILKVESPQSKHLADELLVTLKDGSQVNLPIVGTFEETRDLFSFYRFLLRVVSDIKD